MLESYLKAPHVSVSLFKIIVHLSALDANEFKNSEALQSFSLEVYAALEKNIFFLPPRFQNFFPHMKRHNWLYNYQHLLGIKNSFGGLVHRAKYLDESYIAFSVFNNNYNALRECYNEFFPSLKTFAAAYMQALVV